MTEEEKTEHTPQPEDAGSGDEVPDQAQRSGPDDGEETAAAEGKVEEEEEVIETPPPAESDRGSDSRRVGRGPRRIG